MWSDKKTSESTRVGRYWDNLVTGASTHPGEDVAGAIDPTLVQTISWLERVDDAQPASAEFSRQFEAQFLQAIGTAPGSTTRRWERPARPLPTFPVQRDFSQDHHVKVPLPPSDFSGKHNAGSYSRFGEARWIAIAAAFVLLLVISLAGQHYLSERRGESPDPNVILAPSISIDVPMDRGNPARSGIMPGPGISDELSVYWSFEAGLGAISAPAIAGDTIFVTNWSDPIGVTGDQGAVIAIDASTGIERWRLPTDHPTSATPAVAGGIVYAGDAGGTVYALDASTGEERWRKDLQGKWTSEPVVFGDTVIIAATIAKAPLHIAVQDGTVVVGSGFAGRPADGFRVYAFDRRTGEERWHAGDDRSGQPGLFAFDSESGAPMWQFALPSLESGPAIADEHVLAGSSLDSTMYALDLASGSETWRAPIAGDLPINSSPAVSGGRVFVATTSGVVLCLSEVSGEVCWESSAEHASLTSSPVVVGSTVYVVDTEFGVSAVSAIDGAVLWNEQLDLSGQVVVSPVVVNGKLFIGTSLESNTAYAATLWALAGSGER